MRDQGLVLDCFPFAEARHAPAIRWLGDASPLRDREWAIFAGPDDDSARLGRGPSEAIAWVDAAEQLELAAV